MSRPFFPWLPLVLNFIIVACSCKEMDSVIAAFASICCALHKFFGFRCFTYFRIQKLQINFAWRDICYHISLTLLSGLVRISFKKGSAEVFNSRPPLPMSISSPWGTSCSLIPIPCVHILLRCARSKVVLGSFILFVLNIFWFFS